ncbi:hypothetical protein [Ferrimonas lipolytica]|uniref:Uncharacterized protein n=1 Tax=Ferrimonas lipolytica TaxID=2724191 RepID=A0A6H1UH57_9GAMM|nr:hypothetical protein [Ferrimonas lipolytica]QIZ77940.1 hypothetical protein HER31_14175 [Ferrimonas lipolytica]
MMNAKLLLVTALVGSLVVGCSDDDDDKTVSVPEVNPPETSTPESTPEPATGTGVFENVWGPDVKFELNTTLYAYLDGQLDRQDMVDQFQRKTPANGIAIDPEKLRQAKSASLEAEDGLYIVSEMFNDNQITFADALMYLSQTRTDFHVDYEWDDSLKTYLWEVSYDKNGDGDFDDEGDSKADPNWYATYMIDFGEFRRELFYEPSGEALYMRLETVLIQPNSGLHFRSYSPMMTKRRQSVHKFQAELKAASKPSYYDDDTDVIVVPMVSVTPIETLGDETMSGEMLMFQNVEARSHNLRPDIFKKDKAITRADVLLSMREQGLIDVGYSFWGTLESGVDIQHFLLNEINGVRGSGVHGYGGNTGVSWAMADFAAKYLVSQQTELNNSTGALTSVESTQATYCDHVGQSNPYDPSDNSLDHPDGIIDEVGIAALFEDCDPELTDITDWYADQEAHIFGDVWVMNYPGDMMWVGHINMYGMYAPAESQRWAGDEKWPIYDTKDAVKPLDEQHFGWGVADCGNCHSLDGIHVDGDIADGLGVNPTPVSILDTGVQSYPESDRSKLVVAPFQCAECHGGNGAPAGHGETGRCFWCHSEDFEPTGHGTINSYITKMYEGGNTPTIPNRTYEVVDVDSNDADAVAALEAKLQQDLVPWMDLSIYPGTEGVSWQGYWGYYPDDMKVRTNSDWTTDPVYPDPYACVTCHAND